MNYAVIDCLCWTVKRSPFQCATLSIWWEPVLTLLSTDKGCAFRQPTNVQTYQKGLVRDYKSKATIKAIFVCHVVKVKLVQTFGTARRRHYTRSHSAGLACLSTWREASRQLMFFWWQSETLQRRAIFELLTCAAHTHSHLYAYMNDTCRRTHTPILSCRKVWITTHAYVTWTTVIPWALYCNIDLTPTWTGPTADISKVTS